MVDSFFVLHLGDEDHPRVALPDLFQRLQVSDLHGCLRVQFLGCQTHQLCRFHIRLRRYDLALSQSFLLGCTRQRVLEVFAQLDILDEDLFDLPTNKLTSTPHSATYWSTCFSMSSAISCLFSSKSCKMNCPQVFLRMA